MPHVSKNANFSEKGIKNARLATLPGMALKPRRQPLDHFISKQWAVKLQRFGKSGVKLWLLSWWSNGVRTTCAHLGSLKHLFSHELVWNSTQLNSGCPDFSTPKNARKGQKEKKKRRPKNVFFAFLKVSGVVYFWQYIFSFLRESSNCI